MITSCPGRCLIKQSRSVSRQSLIGCHSCELRGLLPTSTNISDNISCAEKTIINKGRAEEFLKLFFYICRLTRPMKSINITTCQDHTLQQLPGEVSIQDQPMSNPPIVDFPLEVQAAIELSCQVMTPWTRPTCTWCSTSISSSQPSRAWQGWMR